jgi:hypothetical protein
VSLPVAQTGPTISLVLLGSKFKDLSAGWLVKMPIKLTSLTVWFFNKALNITLEIRRMTNVIVSRRNRSYFFLIALEGCGYFRRSCPGVTWHCRSYWPVTHNSSKVLQFDLPIRLSTSRLGENGRCPLKKQSLPVHFDCCGPVNLKLKGVTFPGVTWTLNWKLLRCRLKLLIVGPVLHYNFSKKLQK